MTEPRSAILAAGLLALCACGPAPPQSSAAQAAGPPAKPLPPAQTGVASYYAPSLAGQPTASGEPHRPDALTAASRTLPLGTVAEVTNTETGRSVHVRVNDRGPFARRRILDVSPKAARRLGMKDDGVAKVEVQPLRVPSGQQVAAR